MHSLSPFYFKQRPNSINLIVKQPQRDSIYLAIYYKAMTYAIVMHLGQAMTV